MQIHYFQRYHSKENVDTANTMLMLSRLYSYDVKKFFSMLNSLILNENSSPELSIELQSTGDESTPDAVIFQNSFMIVVETKLYNNFDLDQLKRHLSKFTNEEIKVLLTLDPKPMNSVDKTKFEDLLNTYNQNLKSSEKSAIKHVNLTFEQLVSAMEDIVDDRDFEILSVLEDYKNYCFEERLIPDDDKWMRAITVGTTLEDNIKYSVYYDLASRGFSPHGYIGLYKNKSIRAIGKLIKTVYVEYKNSIPNFILEKDESSSLTDEEEKRIIEIIEKAKVDHGYDLKQKPHRFFIVENFYDTDFKKASKYPIQRSKYFNLDELFNKDIPNDAKEIAEFLRGKTWEEMVSNNS